MLALGEAVVEGGRVDLFACDLLQSPHGLRALKRIEEVGAHTVPRGTLH